MNIERMRESVNAFQEKVRGSLRWENWKNLPVPTKGAVIGLGLGLVIGAYSPSIAGTVLLAGLGAVSGYAIGRFVEAASIPKDA